MTSVVAPTAAAAAATSAETTLTSNNSNNNGTMSIAKTTNGNATPSETNDDPLYRQLQEEIQVTLQEEPELAGLLYNTVLSDDVHSFEDAVAATVAHRLFPHHTIATCVMKKLNTAGVGSGNGIDFCPSTLKKFLMQAMHTTDEHLLEYGHTMAQAVRLDALAVLDRDPACHSILEVILFYKGFSALVSHRAARQKWIRSQNQQQRRSNMTALFLQSQASANFGVDIHPGATIGAGVFLDHGTGIVIGETAWVGDGCTLLHGVTLGGTGKDSGDRHPKVGTNVLIGAGASILGNIIVGHSSKIGAGSIVLRPIPPFATAVGAPAKIIGRSTEANPAANMDDILQNVDLLHKSPSLKTLSSTKTATTVATTDTSSATTPQEEELTDNSKTTTPTTPTPTDRDTQESGDDGTTSSISSHGSDNDYDSSGNNNNNHSDSDPDDVINVCPYREYRRMSNIAPSNSITICKLYKLLSKVGCPHDVIGCSFFALDTENVGYVHCTKENCQRLLEILKEEWKNKKKEWTKLDEDKFIQLLKNHCPSKQDK